MNRMFQWAWVLLATAATVGCAGDDTPTDSGMPVDVPPETSPELQVVEEFTQTQFDVVNILWVIDPGWQTAIGNHFTPGPLDEFYDLLLINNVQWQMAIMTPLTDPELLRGELRNIHDTLPAPINSPYIVLGTGPTNFRAAVEWTLTERLEDFPDFYFGNGHLSIIAFADTADQTPPSFIGRQAFIDFILKQDVTGTASISAVTVGEAAIRDSWREYATPTGGVVSTSNNASLNMERMALASMGLTKSWTLQEVPATAPQTIVQTYRGNQRLLEIGKDFTFDFNSNSFEIIGDAPFTGTTFTVTYQRRVDGVNDAPTAGGSGTPPATP